MILTQILEKTSKPLIDYLTNLTTKSITDKKKHRYQDRNRGGAQWSRNPPRQIFAPLEKYAGRSLKVLDI